MNITKENINELNAVITIKLGADDYQSRVSNILSEHQKRARMNGFRPGMVPMGLIKKMYRKPVLVDEINKILYDSLYKYISENKIELLGSPLPKNGEDSKIDWDNQTEFEFNYEMGLSPEFNIDTQKLASHKIPRYTIKVDDTLIDKYVDYIRKRYGKPDNPAIAQNDELKPAELNQELFDKVYGPGNVNSEDAFRNKIREEAASMMIIESEKKYKNDIIDKLIEKTKLSLPDDFLKRWLIKISEKPVTLDQVNDEYDNFARNMKWQLIKSKIVKENSITVSKEEALSEAGKFIRFQYAHYVNKDMDEKEIEDIANKILENEEEAKKVYERVFEDKIMNLLIKTFKIEEEEVSYDEFVKLAIPVSAKDEKSVETGFTKFFKAGFWKK